MSRSPIESYRDLNVWSRGIDLVESIYGLSKTFPKHEQYGLTSQVRQAAVSIPSNIAEGWGRYSVESYLYHLDVARSSLMEMETQVSVAKRLHYLPCSEEKSILQATNIESRMLLALMKSLRE